MPPDDLESLLHACPFVPFRTTLSTGDRYEVRHPELVMAGKRSVVIGISQDPTPRYDRSVIVSLLHIVRLEPLETAAA